MNYSWKDTSHVSCASRSRSGGWVLGYGDSAESNVIRNGLEKDSLHCFSSLFTSFVFLNMTCISSTWSLMLGMVIGCTWWLHVARYLKPECPKWTNNHKFQVYVNDTYRCIMVYPCIHFWEDIASTYTITCSFISFHSDVLLGGLGWLYGTVRFPQTLCVIVGGTRSTGSNSNSTPKVTGRA